MWSKGKWSENLPQSRYCVLSQIPASMTVLMLLRAFNNSTLRMEIIPFRCHCTQWLTEGSFIMNKKNKILIIIAVVLVCLMIGVFFFWKPSTIVGTKNITVNVVHLNGEPQTFNYKTDAEYLGEYLQKEGLIEGEDAEYGLMVTAVDGETADASKEQWWGYTVNGEFSNYGVDTQPINEGDVYEFTLNEGYNNF